MSVGLTKQYLRYNSSGCCNIVASTRPHLLSIDPDTLAVGASENVYFWNMRTTQKTGQLCGDGCVSVVERSGSRGLWAVGYVDGVVKVFQESSPSQPQVVFTGHSSAVSSLCFSSDGLLLASGGQDSTVIVWDVVSESGRCRLSGHKGPITRVRFAKGSQFLISSSKDSFLKFWDLSTQHCFYTLPAHRTEVWDFVLLKGDKELVTGSSEQELQIFGLSWTWDPDSSANSADANPLLSAKKAREEENIDSLDWSQQENKIVECFKVGVLLRQNKGRVSQLVLSADEKLLLCQSVSAFVDVYRVYGVEERERRVGRKLRKARKKGLEESVERANVEGDLSTRFLRLGDFRGHSKPKSLVFTHHDANQNQYTAAAVLGDNSVLEFILKVEEKSVTYSKGRGLTLGGHRTDVRGLSFSNDNLNFATCSSDSLKVWNRSSLQPIRTLPCTDALCVLFVPGDRHCVVGLKFLDMKVPPYGQSVLPLTSDERVVSLKNSRTLEVPDEVLCMKTSDNGKFLAVGLLDNTARVYFVDTLKFFLSLYGHTLPVLCLDISSDSALVVTGSADKNVKIWGLDFGDCHRSLFAHDDTVTCVKFVPNTHYFFSCGKDGKVKEWNADKFEKIQVLKNPQSSEIWAMAVSWNGNHIVAAAHDKSIRVWEKSEEVLVVDEEQEMEREEDYEKAVTQTEDVVPGEIKGEASLASKKTTDTVKGAENIIQAIDIRQEELDEDRKDAKPDSHPIIKALGSKSVNHFVLDVIRRIRSSDLEKSLLMVPFNHALQVLEALSVCIGHGYMTELACRVVFFITRIHHNQIVNSDAALPVIERLRSTVPARVEAIRDCAGFNLAALNLLSLELEEEEKVKLFADATFAQKRKKKAKKRKEVFTLNMV